MPLVGAADRNNPVWRGFVLVMPQFLAGIGLACIRVSFGLRWSIAARYAIDMLTVLPVWLYPAALERAECHRLPPAQAAVGREVPRGLHSAQATT